MAQFVLPVFNITVKIWRGTAYPPPPGVPSGPANVTSIANLSPGRITSGVNPEGLGIDVGVGPMWLRLPVGTDIQDTKNGGYPDVVECPAGSQRMYVVAFVDDIGGAFANEHRFAIIVGQQWPVPFPPVGGPFPPPPPGPSFVLAQLGSGGAGPVNTINAAITSTTNFALIFAAFGDQAAIPVCQYNGGAALGYLVPTYTGLQAFGFHTGAVLVFVANTIPGVGNISLTFPGIATGGLAFVVVEWPGWAGVFDNFNGAKGNPPPQQVPAWGAPVRAHNLNIASNLSNLMAGPPTVFDPPFNVNRANVGWTLGGAQFFFQLASYFQPLAGTYMAKKNIGTFDTPFAMNQVAAHQ